MNKSFCWIIPASLKLEELFKRDPPDFSYKVDHFYYVLDYISRKLEYTDLEESFGYVNINAQTLQKVFRNYKKVIVYLLKHGVVATDNKVIRGKKSKGYSIHDNYLKIGFIEIEATSGAFKTKVRSQREKIKAREKATVAEYYYLTKWFNPQLKIDEVKAREVLDKVFPLKVDTEGIKGKINYSRSSGRYKALLSINKLKKADFDLKIDDNIGRFHSNLTNMKKELRACITYKGEQLVNLDIKNSQPFFSTFLLRENFYNEETEINIFKIKKIEEVVKDNKAWLKEIDVLIIYIMLVISSETQSGSGFSKYEQMVWDGTIYEDLMSLFALKIKGLTRDTMKVEVLRILFSDNRGVKTMPAKKLFQSTFPDVYEVFAALKRQNNVILSHILQRIESTIIIEKAARRIGEEQPGLPIFTIHDSIVCTVGNEDYVESVIKSEVNNVSGLECQIGREYWL